MKKLLDWHLILLAVALVASPGATYEQEIPDPGFSLTELSARIDRQIAALSQIVMHEEITRYDSARGGTGKVDKFDASVEMSGGEDSFAFLRRNGHLCAARAPIRGAWSSGEFSTLLRVSRGALSNGTVRLISAPPSTNAAVVLSFHYPASSGRWYIAVADRIYWLDLQGEIQISATTGEVQRISWTSNPAAPEADIRQVQRTVSFAQTDVGGESYILPEQAEYRVIHSGNRVEWNTARFENPARYGSRVSISYAE